MKRSLKKIAGFGGRAIVESVGVCTEVRRRRCMYAVHAGHTLCRLKTILTDRCDGHY